MATINTGTRFDVSSWSKADIKDKAVHSKIETVIIGPGSGSKHLTGSLAGSSGFIVTTAGTGVITATDGGDMSTSDFVADTINGIGVQRISGSCTVNVLY